MIAATTVAHDAAQLKEDDRVHALCVPAPEHEEPLNPQLRWEDSGVEEVGGEESDHAPDVARLLEIGTQVTFRSATHTTPSFDHRGTGTGAQI
jgi:hypothetical protein